MLGRDGHLCGLFGSATHAIPEADAAPTSGQAAQSMARWIRRRVRSHLDVSGAPAIPGLTFRRFRGHADYRVMVSILDACHDADGLEYANTVEDIALLFSHLANCDPYRDMLFAEVQGKTVA